MSRRPTVKRPNLFWYRISKFFVMCFCRVWFRLRFEGRKNIPVTGPIIIAANHASYLDPLVVGLGPPRWLLFLAQAGLARFAPARWWMAQVGVTLIDRDAPSKTALRLLSDSLAAGHPVCLFPEGTRSRDGTVGPFRSGVEFLVRRTGAPVLPVGVDGSARAMPRSAWFPRPRKIVVRYGEVWSAERVLAAGGNDALRRCVAELARAPVSDGPVSGAPVSGAPVSGAPVSGAAGQPTEESRSNVLSTRSNQSSAGVANESQNRQSS
jgi:1-acyl-sn-glycerol-3-phosphate acyltransferase